MRKKSNVSENYDLVICTDSLSAVLFDCLNLLYIQITSFQYSKVLGTMYCVGYRNNN